MKTIDLNQFYNDLKKRIQILEKYIEYQNEFLADKEFHQNFEIQLKVDEELYNAKKQAEDYTPNSKAQERIKTIEDELNYISLLELPILEKLSIENKLLRELETLQFGFSETEITEAALNYYSNDEENFLTTFKMQQNDATLMIIYSHFEYTLKQLYEEFKNKKYISIHYYELGGDTILQCKKYLTKFCNVNKCVFESSYWHFLDTMRILRNAIVHNNNYLKKEVINSTPYFQDELKKLQNIEDLVLEKDKEENFIFLNFSTKLSVLFLENILRFYGDLENVYLSNERKRMYN